MGLPRPTRWVPVLPDGVIDELFRQSLIGGRRGDPYLEGLRRYTRLVEAEIQGRLAHRDFDARRGDSRKGRLCGSARGSDAEVLAPETLVVPGAGLEPAHLAAGDFESPIPLSTGAA